MKPEPSADRLSDIAGWMRQGQFELARAALQELTQAHPASAAAWKMLGVSQNKLGCAEAAESSLRTSLRLDASDPDTWSSLGGVYVVLGRHTDALEAFERGLARDPTDTYALLNTLSMAALVADFDAARHRHAAALQDGQRHCETQAASGTNVPWCWYDLAQLHFLDGVAAGFRSALQQAIAASSPWQVASARKTYELLARSAALKTEAGQALAEFARLAPERQEPGP
jgi:tetratricopeptide (TPR) repeat protein